MKKALKNYLLVLAFCIAVVVCVGFVTYTLSLMSTYSEGVTVQASSRAEFYADEQAHYVALSMDSLKNYSRYLAAILSDAHDEASLKEEIQGILADKDKDDDLLDIIYSRNGKLYSYDGILISEYPMINDICKNKGGEELTYFLYRGRTSAVAVASAASPSPYFDAVVAIYDKDVLSLENSFDIQDECVASADFILLFKNDGRIVSRIENNENFEIGNLPVQDGLVQSLFSESGEIYDVTSALFDGDTVSFTFKKDNDEYVMSLSHLGHSYGDVSLMCAYKVENIYGEGFSLMQSLLAALLGLALIMAILICVILFSMLNAKRRRYQLEMVDSSLNCPTEKKFMKRSEELLKVHANSDFAFVSLTVNNFGYVREHFGDNAGKKLLKFAVQTIHGAMMIEECFGYVGDGEFLMLLQHRDRKSFSERLNGIYLRLAAFDELADAKYKVNVAFSVYEVEREPKQSMTHMIEKLKMAKDASLVRTDYLSISYYEDIMHEKYIKTAEIEGKMEQALQNSEFHLFYQPKYNLKTKNMDGCEILIRWYDPEISKYHVPSEFLPVFEKNLFIVKLDHFVFFKACENISNTTTQRQKCYPVSVNVSRVTAIQPDFVDYYIRIKKKFNIKDNFITLEFTESFAYENYEFLSDIVKKLHDNGFMCSIDDFGTGYSSYNILKTIKMDEIKLDKFFLDKGLSEERDQLLLESVIEMVKKLGMKVTQEGVETKEDLYRLEKLGCDVIQGYYFAKPMKYSDFCDFVKTNFS